MADFRALKVDSGKLKQLEDADNLIVGGGIKTNTGNLTVAPAGGTTAITGAVTVSGNTTLGDASTDTVTLTARVSGNIYFLKETTHSLWVDNSTGNNDGGTLSILAGSVTGDGTGGDLTLFAGSAGGAGNGWGGTVTIQSGGGHGTGGPGNINIWAGGCEAGTENGGNVVIRGGATVGGTNGIVKIGDGATSAVELGVVFGGGSTTPVRVGYNIDLSKEEAHSIGVEASTTTNANGGDLYIYSGEGVGTGVGGLLNLASGNGNGTGADGGTLSIGSGSPGAGGTGGTMTLQGGNAVSGNSTGGAINIFAGSGSGTAAGADITITAGTANGTGTGGSVSILAGSGPTLGTINLGTSASTSTINIDAASQISLLNKTVVPSTNTEGILLYNTADQTTNYQRTRLAFSGGNFVLKRETGGTGTAFQTKLTTSAATGYEVTIYDSKIEISKQGTGIFFDFSSSGLLTMLNGGNISLPNNGTSRFQIEGSSVGATVTAANLNTLTNGSNADALHVHAAAAATEAPQVVVTGLTTTGLADGDFAYLSSNNTVSKTDSSAIASSRCLGANEGTAGKVTTGGFIENAKMVTGLTVSAGQPVYLAGGADAGKLTNVAPGSGVVAEVGLIADTTNYAGSTTCKIALQIKAPIIL